jgi:hypothetical protein
VEDIAPVAFRGWIVRFVPRGKPRQWRVVVFGIGRGDGLIDMNSDGIILTDRRIILWQRDGATTTLLRDEVRTASRVSELFATLLIWLPDSGAPYSLTVGTEFADAMTEFATVFIAGGEGQRDLASRGQRTTASSPAAAI